ncbi:hypothetical protein Scep_029531 [Stephania cephalantha]|uniref:Uncharacterized protein n=1 Tax=Stephania cephalantha TaxID=152367 RepID=A0AAP0E0U5_9MAGN
MISKARLACHWLHDRCAMETIELQAAEWAGEMVAYGGIAGSRMAGAAADGGRQSKKKNDRETAQQWRPRSEAAAGAAAENNGHMANS